LPRGHGEQLERTSAQSAPWGHRAFPFKQHQNFIFRIAIPAGHDIKPTTFKDIRQLMKKFTQFYVTRKSL